MIPPLKQKRNKHFVLEKSCFPYCLLYGEMTAIF